MTLPNITHVQMVRILYKSILRLHRGLPAELRIIGDQYVKDEFRRHTNAKPEEAEKFLSEWIKYGTMMSSQLGLRGPHSGSKLGQHLSEEQIDYFQDNQLGQLIELYQETTKIYGKDVKHD